MTNKNIDLVITDMRMDGMSGSDLLEYFHRKDMKVPVIIMTGYGTIESAVAAMKMGAYDYITKPFEYDEIVHRAKKAISGVKTDLEIGSMLRAMPEVDENDFSMLVGRSRVLSEIKMELRKIANTDLPVLITGETGTGKNLLAKAIHLNSSRRAGPFKSVNCTSIPEHLFESELFGHTKGAFTGAIMERKGLFEAANGGTILLDEIGAIPKTVQVKLLGVLQDDVIRKVGRDQEIPINVRVIAATNVDPSSVIKKGEFREDLYYRLNVLNIHVPPLRSHKEDIFDLSEHFLSICKSRQNKQHISGFGPEVMDKLYNYDFPGNVRELYNIVCRAVALADSS
ncbi:MAG: sigma-54 dependent transcriptional regulator, partial [Nitrospirota bacterium]